MKSFILVSWKQWSPYARESDSLGFSTLCHGYCILDSMSVELRFWISIISGIQNAWPLFQIPKPRIPDSKRKISWIPDSLTLGNSDPEINAFSVKQKPVNWASNYCRLSVHVVLVTKQVIEMGVCTGGPGEIVAGIVVFQNQLGMIVKQLGFSSKT